MKKLKLDLDALTVEAFETVNTPAAVGTVDAHGRTLTVICGTCYVSCNVTACPLDCQDTGGFYSECCSPDCTPACTIGEFQTACCDPTVDYTCGQACTQVCP